MLESLKTMVISKIVAGNSVIAASIGGGGILAFFGEKIHNAQLQQNVDHGGIMYWFASNAVAIGSIVAIVGLIGGFYIRFKAHQETVRHNRAMEELQREKQE